jgi:alkyl sulfatase BDS1-like metallo-beta-lactamase superfamily hydrolase
MDATNTNSAKLQQQVGTDPDILMREMARSIDPKTTARLRAVLQFDFPDRQRHYRFTVDKGRCELKFEATKNPDLRVTCNTDIWVALFMRQLNVAAALRQGVIALEGDKSLFTRLDRYFPPPSV